MDIEEQLLVAQAEMIGRLTAWANGLPFEPDRSIAPRDTAMFALILCRSALGPDSAVDYREVADEALALCRKILAAWPDRGAELLRGVGELVAGQLSELRERQRPAGGRA